MEIQGALETVMSFADDFEELEEATTIPPEKVECEYCPVSHRNGDCLLSLVIIWGTDQLILGCTRRKAWNIDVETLAATLKTLLANHDLNFCLPYSYRHHYFVLMLIITKKE